MRKPILHILPLEEDKKYASFYLYLPANDNESDEYYVKYRFIYEINPYNPELSYDNGPNNPSNREFYRIKKAYVVRKEGEDFVEVFRALQGGEIGFALREVGAGDFIGGVHGDEVMLEVKLTVDGKEQSLKEPFFGAIESFEFYEQSEMFRCNTPEDKLMLHTQTYTIDGNTLRLKQDVEWVGNARVIQKAFMPMLTAQRLNPDNFEQILSDTVEFYGMDGELLQSFDTTPYGVEGNGEPWVTVCEKTPATSVKVYGKTSGFMAEAGYSIREDSIPKEQIDTNLCIRYMRGAVDNKIYFDIAGGTSPKRGTAWRSDVFYRITYTPITE